MGTSNVRTALCRNASELYVVWVKIRQRYTSIHKMIFPITIKQIKVIVLHQSVITDLKAIISQKKKLRIQDCRGKTGIQQEEGSFQ